MSNEVCGFKWKVKTVEWQWVEIACQSPMGHAGWHVTKVSSNVPSWYGQRYWATENDTDINLSQGPGGVCGPQVPVPDDDEPGTEP